MTEWEVIYKTNLFSENTDISQSNTCTQTVQKKVIELATISLGRESSAPDVNEPLYRTEAGFDSIALLEFILRLEDEFRISIPDEDLDPEIFRSINTIVPYVLRRLGEGVSLQ
jgi:acyl carrier protein